jgi:sarcosine oxidase subunit beta
MEEIECPYTEAPINKIDSYLSGANTSSFSPEKTLEGETFGEPTAASVSGAVFFLRGGHVNDPKLSAQNVQRVAKVHGAQFKCNTAVAKILQVKGRVSGVELSDGSTIEALIVISIAGPHSSNINEMAGVADTLNLLRLKSKGSVV